MRTLHASILSAVALAAMTACTASSADEAVASVSDKLDQVDAMDGDTVEVCELVWVEDDPLGADGGAPPPSTDASVGSPVDTSGSAPDNDGGALVSADVGGLVVATSPAGSSSSGIRIQGRWSKICRTVGRCVTGTNPLSLLRKAEADLEALQKIAAEMKRIQSLIDDPLTNPSQLRFYREQLLNLQNQYPNLSTLIVRAKEQLAFYEKAYADYLARCKSWGIIP